MNKRELVAYLAGLFDAEGSILIDKKKPRWGNKTVQYILTVALTNTHPELVRLVHEHYGGRVVGPVYQNERQRPFYRWNLSGRAARGFLQDIEPYLIIKRDRVALAYELQDRIENYQSDWKAFGNKPLSAEEVQIRETIYQRFRRLNRRGVSEDEN